jgi:hypothetical protein
VDPIWTLSTGSLFLLAINIEKLFLSNGLTLIVYDYDSLGSDEQLGTVTFTPKEIYDANGEREELKLQPPHGKAGEVPGHLALRCRRATEHDIHFMTAFKRPDSKKADILGMKKLNKAVESKGGAGAVAAVLTRKIRIAKHGRNTGKKEVSWCLLVIPSIIFNDVHSISVSIRFGHRLIRHDLRRLIGCPMTKSKKSA